MTGISHNKHAFPDSTMVRHVCLSLTWQYRHDNKCGGGGGGNRWLPLGSLRFKPPSGFILNSNRQRRGQKQNGKDQNSVILGFVRKRYEYVQSAVTD